MVLPQLRLENKIKAVKNVCQPQMNALHKSQLAVIIRNLYLFLVDLNIQSVFNLTHILRAFLEAVMNNLSKILNIKIKNQTFKTFHQL